jgi:HD superfamily phosphohydrolase
MANLEIARISTGVDEQTVGEIETFVLGLKAYYSAETYILALFQLYPTVYFHKTTRVAEKLFSVLERIPIIWKHSPHAGDSWSILEH